MVVRRLFFGLAGLVALSLSFAFDLLALPSADGWLQLVHLQQLATLEDVQVIGRPMTGWQDLDLRVVRMSGLGPVFA
ncbi:hypothetical protein [Ferrovibrio terrae]|uniref:hypothetical protein n=1 Tax=Ferrovibrio terrae TaxID=2594003 RepID=UPI003137E398